MSEHGAGSDLAAVKTRATQTDGGWVLNGTKVWTSGAHLAHQIVVLARTSPLDPEHRHAGSASSSSQLDAPGVTIDPIVLMGGEHHFNEVHLRRRVRPRRRRARRDRRRLAQVTSELGFERSGPERILSTATLILGVIRALGRRTTSTTAPRPTSATLWPG